MHSEKSIYRIGSDMNVNLLKYQIDTYITDYVNNILSLGCISLINKPTRFSSSQQPSLLDHIYANIIDDNTNTKITLYGISDHLPTFANFNFHRKCAKKYRTKIHCLNNFEMPSFLEDLKTPLFNFDFHNPKNSDVNIICNNFILMFNNIPDQLAALRFASRKETRSFHKPWLIKGLLTSISKKNALYKKNVIKKQLNFSQVHVLQKWNYSPQRTPKQNYYRSKFENCRNDVKKLEKY